MNVHALHKPMQMDAEFSRLIVALCNEGPCFTILAKADAADVDERSEHIARILRAVGSYVRAVIEDTASSLPYGADDLRKASDTFDALAHDVVGEICI